MRIVGLLGMVLALSSTAAEAQLQRSLDVGAGIAAGDGTGAGAVAHIAFEAKPERSPIALRLDGSHHQWNDGFLTGRRAFRASATTLNVVYRVPVARVRPYVLGGVGAYALQGEGTATGWNVGGGVEMQVSRYRLFTEARSHFVDSQFRQRLTPLVFGLRF
jgi:hypothetical protein